MKTIIFLAMVLMTVSVPALAVDKTDGMSGSLAVTKMICNQSVLAKAAENNGAAYQEGVDVNGNPVAPADISSSPVKLPDYIEVPMTIDLAKKMNMPQVGAEMELPVANLKLYRNGKVEYNGQDITSNTAALCGENKPAPTPAEETAKKSDKTSSVQPVVQAETTAMVVPDIEPAAGQESMTTAVSETVTSVKGDRQPVTRGFNDDTPASGSVILSATSPEPKIEVNIERETVNRYTIDMNAADTYDANDNKGKKK